ncbi:MAG: hypothetical protein AABZ30_14245 [Myxococcota bacterium]
MWLRFARRTPIAELDSGVAVVEGRVVAEKRLVIAGSQTRPVWLDMTVEVYTTGSRARGRAMWIPRKAEQQIVAFAVEDEGGRVWIDATDRSRIAVRGGRREIGSSGKRGTSRYVARFIAPGDVVRVRGEVRAARKGEGAGKALRPPEGRPLEILFRKAGDAG